jgi:hypothetical protein
MFADVLAFHERLTVCVDTVAPPDTVVLEETPAQPISKAVAAKPRIFGLSRKRVRTFMSESRKKMIFRYPREGQVVFNVVENLGSIDLVLSAFRLSFAVLFPRVLEDVFQ